MQDRFNQIEGGEVLIGSIYTMSHGLNLQKKCHWVLLLDPPPSQQHGAQWVARVQRVGQEEVVELVTLNVEQTFNDRQNSNNLRKATAETLASLNSTIFGGDILSTNDQEEVSLEVGDWVQYNNQLHRTGDPIPPAGHNLPTISGFDLIIQVISNQKGTPINRYEDPENDEE